MDYISTNPSYTFKINRNRKLTAVFTSNIPVYTITATIDPAGSGAVTGAGQYQEGATATITATPAEGYTFSGWTENGATVSTSESYTFTVTGNRTLVAGFVEFVPRLPDGYTELKYIESTGTQYINASYYPSLSTKIILDVQATSIDSGRQYYFGNVYRTFNGASGKYTYYYCLWYTRGSVHYAELYYTQSLSVTTLSGENTTDRVTLILDSNSRAAYVGDKKTSLMSAISSKNMKSLYLLGLNVEGGTYLTNYPMSAKLYSAQIYTRSTLMRDFVPCTNPSGAVGLYDLVSGSFYGNAGTGSFIPGPAV